MLNARCMNGAGLHYLTRKKRYETHIFQSMLILPLFCGNPKAGVQTWATERRISLPGEENTLYNDGELLTKMLLFSSYR